jgi:hypothetical protein
MIIFEVLACVPERPRAAETRGQPKGVLKQQPPHALVDVRQHELNTVHLLVIRQG